MAPVGQNLSKSLCGGDTKEFQNALSSVMWNIEISRAICPQKTHYYNFGPEICSFLTRREEMQVALCYDAVFS